MICVIIFLYIHKYPHLLTTSTDDAEASELARATPTAGDEGVLEEVVKMGINNVTAVLQNADMQDVVKEGSKLVAKTVRVHLVHFYLLFFLVLFETRPFTFFSCRFLCFWYSSF